MMEPFIEGAAWDLLLRETVSALGMPEHIAGPYLADLTLKAIPTGAVTAQEMAGLRCLVESARLCRTTKDLYEYVWTAEFPSEVAAALSLPAFSAERRAAVFDVFRQVCQYIVAKRAADLQALVTATTPEQAAVAVPDETLETLLSWQAC